MKLFSNLTNRARWSRVLVQNRVSHTWVSYSRVKHTSSIAKTPTQQGRNKLPKSLCEATKSKDPDKTRKTTKIKHRDGGHGFVVFVEDLRAWVCHWREIWVQSRAWDLGSCCVSFYHVRFNMELKCFTLDFQLELNSCWINFKEQNRV